MFADNAVRFFSSTYGTVSTFIKWACHEQKAKTCCEIVLRGENWVIRGKGAFCANGELLAKFASKKDRPSSP